MADDRNTRSVDAPDQPQVRQRVLVLGATGYVGSRLIPELLEYGYDVCGLARSPRKLAARPFADDANFEVLRGDVLDTDSLARAMVGVDIVYYLVHSMGRGNDDFAQDDLVAAANVAAAADDAGVDRIIYLSGLGNESDDLSHHLRSRHDTGRELARGTVPVTELRAAIIVGSGSASFEIMRDLINKLPVMVTPRWLKTRCEPIAIRDVIAYLIAVLNEPRSTGEVLEIGCGETYEYADLLRICGSVYGRTTHILTVPVLTPRLSSYWLHLVTHVDISVARPLVEGLRNDVVCTDTRAREWMDVPLTPYQTAVERSRAVEIAGETPTHWTDARTIEDSENAALAATATDDSGDRSQGSSHVGDVLFDERTYATALSPDDLFERVTRIGGDFGYGRTQILWRIRGAFDRIVGGVGLRRGRPAGQLYAGDVVDFWRVEQLSAPHRFVLRAEMKLPGTARLEFVVAPDGDGSLLTQRATLTDEGLTSRLYWYTILPLHNIVFDQLAQHLIGVRATRVPA